MLCDDDNQILLQHVCTVMPESVRGTFREFLIDICDNDFYYNVRTCFEDRRSDAELHQAAMRRQPALRRLIPTLLKSI